MLVIQGMCTTNTVKTGFCLALTAAACLAFLLASGGCDDNAEPLLPASSAGISPLVINPATVTTTNTFATFEASGGTPPYQWAVSDTSLGSVPESDASAITYTRVAGSNGVNVVSVTDQNHWVAEATVYEE